MESKCTRNESLTPSQRLAVEARGNVLVMAGAGTGKTHTLVERCLDCLCREQASLDEILVVTFTEAAATEMKQRLRAALEQALNTQLPGAPEQRESGSTLNRHLAEQLALFDTAPIGTLHSFCLRLVREHFYELGLDPQLAVLDPGEARLLAEETLDEQFQSHYAGQTDLSPAAQSLIQIYGNGDDRSLRAMLLRVHHYVQTRPDAGSWIADQLARFALPEPVEWRERLNRAVADWRAEWLPVLENLKSGNEKAAELLNIIGKKGDTGVPPVKFGVAPDSLSDKAAADTLEKILAADQNYPHRKKGGFRDPLKNLFAEAAFLHSLLPAKGGREPVAEDWEWVRGHMTALLQLAQEFGQKFAERKRTDGVLDFQDLEQFALKLLWDPAANKPTSIAERWRQKIRSVFVDEYQDINAAQDKIIHALGRESAEANLFLVGDVKQSIYRFRQADPTIFRRYAHEWRGEKGRMIPLTENFRSRESLLAFVNSVFESIMREDVGGVGYDAGARLQFGAPGQRAALGLTRNATPRAELWLRLKGNGDRTPADDDSDGSDLGELEEAEKEARLVARRLRELVGQKHRIWDEEKCAERAVEWRDMAVLLRAPASKSEAYAKEFERGGVPLVVERGGFYDSTEISDLLSLLKLLDNPLQDVPTIAVLRSPLVGLSLDGLATIRLAARNVRFWTALNRVQSSKSKVQSRLTEKVTAFLERFSRWRQLARQTSLSQCLECVLAETHYAGWLGSRPRGAQRQANVERFLGLAQQFDQFQRQGLFRFLKFVEAQQAAEAEPEVAATLEQDAVRLMSIHQSKGLEFPVVVVADLAKRFNEQDLRGEIILDEALGVCPRVKPPHTGRRYPSLPHWLAQRRQRREQRGEELRLLYVAMTRARDTLILTASVSESKWNSFWQKPGCLNARTIVGANSCADWLGIWFGIRSSEFGTRNSMEGELSHLRWRLVPDKELSDPAATGHRPPAVEWPVLDGRTKQKLHEVLTWQYAFDAATRRAAKSSVTALRRRAEELDDESEPVFRNSSPPPKADSRKRPGRLRPNPESDLGSSQLDAAAIGTSHHKFLQYFSLESAHNLKSLEAEAKRLQHEKILSADEVAALDLAGIGAFWASSAGRKILSQRDRVQRELPFTAKFNPAELDAIIGANTPPGLEEEFVVVQGVADLMVLLPGEIWLVDFKTDEINPRELAERRRLYEPQLKLYVEALSRIYSRPVTSCWLHFLTARQTVNLKT